MNNDKLKKSLAGINNPLSEVVKNAGKQLQSLNSFKALQETIVKVVSPPNINFVQPKMPKLEIPVNPNLASEFYTRLEKWITNFDQNLDQEHEVGVRLVSFGQAVTFHLEHIGFWNPSLISFSGFTDSGEPVELIQHVSQISILLMKVKRKDPSKPKRPIGFASCTEDDENET